jgi:hypothetical protein
MAKVNVEKADLYGRKRITAEDKRNFSGIGRHPLARQWMLGRLIEAQEKAETASSKSEQDRWLLEVERVNAELKRCGVALVGGS